ncbi:MAG: GIY-YIG nuclease family protein [Candidatus Brocadiia bacterium]
MAKPYHVYVLWSATARRFYIGVTEDVATRVQQHNDGVSRWTKGKGPWEVVWAREFSGLGPARKFENLLKRQKGGAGFYRMTGLCREDLPGSS